MNDTILYKAATRGHADHGWLESYQSFSFAGYYNPQRIQFGVLRVLNDDRVDGGKGFGSHPHDNMEIISIPLEGSLVHKDNMGNTRVVGRGEVQVMSTGRGVFHSEYNNSPDQPAKFLQIWVFPDKLNVTPRYDQVKRNPEKEHNRLQTIISPFPGNSGTAGGASSPNGSPDGTGSAEGTWIYQDAWFHIGRFDKDREVLYERKKKGNGVYLFVISGSFRVNGQPSGDNVNGSGASGAHDQRLDARDGLGIAGASGSSLSLTALDNDSELLVMEVPMENKIQ
jgi:redox-sensitive bicupin YhaK (pirin superfamily)